MNEQLLYRLSDHAREEAERRGIPEDMVDRIMRSPEQILETHSNRKIYQSRIEIGDKRYIIRAIVEQANPLVVITVYRTSKIEKYWSEVHEGDI